MPTYQYACTNPDCGNRFERVQAFTDPALTECPVCEQRVRKVYGSVGVVFKGSGFYRTDSRSESAKANGSAKSDGSDKGDGKAAAAKSGSEATSAGSDGSGDFRSSAATSNDRKPNGRAAGAASTSKTPAAATAS